MVEKLEMLKELAFNADNLQEVAEDLALQAKISEPFSQNGGTGVAASAIVVNAAYSPEVAEDGYASEVLDLGDDNYIVLRLNENFPSRQQSLEEVRVQLAQTLTNAIAQENIDAKAAEITAALDAKDSLSSIATNFKLEIEKADAVDRRNQAVNAEINTFAFELASPKESAITDSFTTANGDFVVLELTEVQLGDKDSLDKERLDLIRPVAEKATSTKEFVSYQQALIEQSKIVQ